MRFDGVKFLMYVLCIIFFVVLEYCDLAINIIVLCFLLNLEWLLKSL